jgi:hypothetical protein
MARKASEMFEIECPCCGGLLKVDPETRSVISHVAKEKPRSLEDLATGVARLKEDAARREETFRRSMEEQKTHKDVLAKKFDELLKQAKDSPDTGPRKKDIDLD